MEIKSIFGGDYGKSEKRDNPLEVGSVPLDLASALSYIGVGSPTQSGEQINHLNSLETATVYSCIRILCESIASLPLKIYKVEGKANVEAVDHDLYDLLALEPNLEQSAYSFKAALVAALAMSGNAYAEISRDRNGNVIGLWLLDPFKTKPIRVQRMIGGQRRNVLVYHTTDGLAEGSEGRIIEKDNILAFPLFSLDGIKGLSPVMVAGKNDIGLARAAMKFGSRFFANGTKAGGVLTQKAGVAGANPKQISEMAASIKKQLEGTASGQTAVIPGDWQYNQLTVTPNDSQFLATRQFQRAEICSIFRVPEFMVASGGSRVTGSSAQQMTLSFIKDTLMPYLICIEQEFHRKLLPKRGRSAGNLAIKFDLSEMLRGDFASTMQAAALGRNWRILTGNEAREMFGYDPIEGEDTLIQPVNMAQVDEDGVPHAVSGSIDIPDTAQDKSVVGQQDTNPDDEGTDPESEETPNEGQL